jgi:RHS repeat-associated protein
LLARTENAKLLIGAQFASAYYFNDGSGNVAGMVYSNGLFAAQYTYDPFGNILRTSGPLASANAYRFSSKEWNAIPGTYYYHYRFYDPSVQRWLNRDPIQEAGGINLYEFAANGAINWFDLYGLCGTLTIDSSGTSGIGNHSWISYTPDNTDKTTTYGTWRAGDGSPGTGPGLNVNREQGRPADATRTEHLDDKQESLLNQTINSYNNKGANGWHYGAPCSTFASDAWNNATGEHLSPYWGPLSNPTSLTHSIISANGGNPNGTATGGTGGSLGNSSGASGNSSSSSSANSSTTPSGNALQSSGSL